MGEESRPDMDKFMNGQGLVAEMALLFFRTVKRSGATPGEAAELTQAYISALIYGKSKE